jgi:hypothetical protein
MTNRTDPRSRHHHPFRKEPTVTHIELRLASIVERQALLRSQRDADRAGHVPARSIRSRLGESLIRLGRRVAGESISAPAWSG